jgi:hypothetical protein
MGCSGSKASAPRFTLTDLRRKIVEENAHQAVLGNHQLRAAVITVCQRYEGEKTVANIIGDSRPVGQYFSTAETLPKDIGAGDRSLAHYINAVKLSACGSASEKLGPAIELERPKIRSDVELQKTVRLVIKQESDDAVDRCVREQAEKVLVMLANRAAAAPPPPPVVVVQSAAPHNRGDEPSRSRSPQQQQQMAAKRDEPPPQSRVEEMRAEPEYEAPSQPQRAPTGSSAYVQQPNQKPNAVGGATNRAKSQQQQQDDLVAPQDAANLPKGDWVKAEGTPYYYSSSEKLYFHPPSHQFYDPANDMWYDPDKDEWYADEDQ